MEFLISKHWHHCPDEEVTTLLTTHPAKGLSPFKAKHRLTRFGPNTVTAKKQQGPLIRFLLQFHQPLVYVLLAAVFSIFTWQQASGYPLEEARTVAVNLFVMIGLTFLFNCRSLTKSMFRIGIISNPWVLVGSGIMIVFQLLYTYAPFMNNIFQSAPISGRDWVIIIVIALAVYGIIGLEKWLRQNILIKHGVNKPAH